MKIPHVRLSRKKREKPVSTCMKDNYWIAAITWKVILLIYSIFNHITITNQYILNVFCTQLSLDLFFIFILACISFQTESLLDACAMEKGV